MFDNEHWMLLTNGVTNSFDLVSGVVFQCSKKF